MAGQVENATPPTSRLTEVCWPVFDFLINHVRQVPLGAAPPFPSVRHAALVALGDAEELARGDPVTERLWEDHVKAILVYVVDYKMINTAWGGREEWFNRPFETDPDILRHGGALGGQNFFEDCDNMQREYELADHHQRPDASALAELLGVFFICLRLGFKGQFHDRPQELADYTRRLYSRLPAYATTRSREMFPEAYRHNQEIRVDYKLGMSLTLVLVVLALVVAGSLFAFNYAWLNQTTEIAERAKWCRDEARPAPTASDARIPAASSAREQ